MSVPNDPNNPYAAPVARVDDLSVPLANEPAERGARLGAFLVDSLVIVVPILVAPLAVAELHLALNENTTGVTLAACGFLLLVMAITDLVLVFRSQQTIGKRLLGIKVVRADGSPCNPWRMLLLRGLVPAVVKQIPFVGYLFMLVDPLLIFRDDRRCLHDFIADTRVVRA